MRSTGKSWFVIRVDRDGWIEIVEQRMTEKEAREHARAYTVLARGQYAYGDARMLRGGTR